MQLAEDEYMNVHTFGCSLQFYPLDIGALSTINWPLLDDSKVLLANDGGDFFIE